MATPLLTEQESPSSRRDDRQDDVPDHDDLLPDASVLEERLPPWMRASRRVAGWTAVIGILFLFMNYRPLWHTDLWGHLAYGRVIWQTGGIPQTEPLIPLARGVPFIDTQWLSQLIGYGLATAFDVEGLKFAYGLAIAACAALLLVGFYQRTQRAWLALLGLVAFLWVEWQQIAIIRPQLAGMICFTFLLSVLARRSPARWQWYAVPLLFVVWANLHGSFIVGLALLACFCLGRAIDVIRHSGRWLSPFRDQRTRDYFLLTELAAVAALVNPYGLGLYLEVLTFGRSPNLADIVEWQPLHLRMAQAQAAAVLALALTFLYRLTPRRVQAAEVLALIGLGIAALWTSRLLAWWAPVAAYVFVLHGDAIWTRRRRRRPKHDELARSGRWTVVTAAVLWIGFALTPLGGRLLHGQTVDLEKALSPFTPIGATNYLKEHPPKGLVFNTYEWGDYLLWAGPSDIQVFLNSHAHLVPTEVWRHYMDITQVASGWDQWLDRYGVNTLVLDKTYRMALIRTLKQTPEWRTAYEDERSAVFVRKKPI
ncbi:MAG: hypothetical protein GXP27_19245 [Planctomycetes bacterium]|nr:hypothetical protein [Planctomycetota bacterium]